MISANAVDAYESRANDGSGGAGGVGEGRRRGNAITCATCFVPSRTAACALWRGSGDRGSGLAGRGHGISFEGESRGIASDFIVTPLARVALTGVSPHRIFGALQR